MSRRKAESTEDLALRTLPHNLEAEKALVGAILVNNAAFERAVEVIKGRDFFRRAHGMIFEAAGRLLDRKREVDLVTLKDELARVGELEECGGPAYISALTDGVPRSANVAHYAAIVLEQSILRRVIHLGNAMVADAYDAEKSSSEIITAADRSIIDLQRGAGVGQLVDLRESHQALYADLEHREQNRGKLIGVDTGFQSINELTLGWEAGELIVLAARPSIGKTAYMLHSAIAAARSGALVAIFSLEMRRRQLEFRMLSTLSGVECRRLKSGFLGEVDYEKLTPAMAELARLPIYIDDRAGRTSWDIRAACRRLRAEHGQGPMLIIIDYVQLIPGTLDKRGASRNEEVTDISRRIKQLADEASAPVFLLSQLSRAGEKEGRRPQLSDLRESGALEQDADKVVFLHRRHHRQSGVTNVIIEKDRNGDGGTLNVTFTRETQTFVDGGEEPAAPPAEEQAAKPKKKPRSVFDRRNR